MNYYDEQDHVELVKERALAVNEFMAAYDDKLPWEMFCLVSRAFRNGFESGYLTRRNGGYVQHD